jgi:copper resistance protein C
MMRPTCLLALAMLSVAPQALTHAFLERAAPPVGSEIAGSPRQIMLTFSEAVEPSFSTIELRDSRGVVVPTDRSHSPPGSNQQLVVELPTLASGDYTVIWHATSVDTHRTEGSYRFTVK